MYCAPPPTPAHRVLETLLILCPSGYCLPILTSRQLRDDVAIEERSENQTLSSGIPVKICFLKHKK